MNTIKNSTETEEEAKTSKKIYNETSNNNITTIREQNEIIDNLNTSKVNIHPGIIGTLKLMRKYYQWPNVYAEIRERINT
jgi:Integrase zinc binding domain